MKEGKGKKMQSGVVCADTEMGSRIREVFKQGPYTQDRLAEIMGLSQGHMSKLIKGDVAWKKEYLQKFCSLYNLNLLELLAGKMEMRISALLTSDGFDYRKINDEGDDLGMAPIPPASRYPLERLYALMIEGDGFLPFLKGGFIVYAAKNSGEDVKEGDMVIFIDDDNNGHLRQVRLSDGYLILKQLNPSGQDIVRPASHLRMLDKVVWINFEG